MAGAGLGAVLMNGIFTGGRTGAVKALPLDPPQWAEIGAAIPMENRISPAAARFAASAENKGPQLWESKEEKES